MFDTDGELCVSETALVDCDCYFFARSAPQLLFIFMTIGL